jgi:hypothetical protein
MLSFLLKGDMPGFRRFIEKNIDQVDQDVISTLKATRDFNPAQRDLFTTLLYFFERCREVGVSAAFEEWERAG